MILVSRITAVLAGATCIFAAGIPQGSIIPSQQKKLTDSQVRMPLTFEPNRGQAPSDIRWISRTPHRTLLLTSTEAILLMNGEKAATVRMKLTGSNTDARTEGVDKLTSISNYFLGNDPSEWRTAIPHYARVKYKDVYRGIDLVYYGADRELEYDFVVAPGADSRQIELAYEGADKIRVEDNGDLVLEVNGRTIRQLRPKVYQMIGSKKQEIAAGYRIRNGNRVEFALAKYDRKRQLVIDPVLQYSTYFGPGRAGPKLIGGYECYRRDLHHGADIVDTVSNDRQSATRTRRKLRRIHCEVYRRRRYVVDVLPWRAAGGCRKKHRC